MFWPALLGAQESTVTGTVTDEAGNPVPYASVALYAAVDSVMVTGAATNMTGEFSLTASPGSYYLMVSFLSYQPRTLSGLVVESGTLDLGSIVLNAGDVMLDDIIVETERSQMMLELDKRVFYVGSDLGNTGNTAQEILDNVPSVTVDVEGNVSLRGSGNVRILIDGKPSSLTGPDALRLLQGSMIESIEVITNPSARYDAEGEVGIINIVLKKENQEGVNGSFNISTGWPHNHSASFSLNFKRKWINWFASYGVNYKQTPGSGITYQRFTEADTTYAYERLRDHTRGGLGHNGNFGADIFLNDYNTITLSGLFTNSVGYNEALIVYNDFDLYDAISQVTTRDEDEVEKKEIIEGNINYRKTFEEKDRLFSIDLTLMHSVDHESSEIAQTTDAAGDVPLLQRYNNTEDQFTYQAQTDYVHPFGTDGKFEMGAKCSWRLIQNKYLVEEQATPGIWSALSAYDNEMIYTENIYAAYAMAGNKTGRFSYQGGVRMEYSDITTELVKTNEINPRDYLNFFPSVHLAYELDSANTLQLSYSNRISRPDFWFLLPFFSYNDPRFFFSGNPNLNPEYTNSFELGYLKYMNKGSVLSSVYYRYRTGVIERITVADSLGFSRIFPINMSTQHAFGLELSFNYDLTDWWALSSGFNFYRAITEGQYEELDLNSDNYSWTAKVTSKLKLFDHMGAQITFDYRAPETTTQGSNKAQYFFTTGLTLDVLKGNGTFTLSVNDVLNSRKRRWIIDQPGFYSEGEFQWQQRQILLSFNYRLNQEKPGSSPQEDY